MSQDEIYTIPEAAQYLQVSEPTIYRWMKDGTLSFYKVGRGTRFTREMLEAVKITHTSRKEASESRATCACCGHGDLVAGRIQSTGKIYFVPDNAKFMILEDAYVATRAFSCTACGFVQIHADPEKTARILKD